MLTKAPKGTADILPGKTQKWQYAEGVIRDICKNFGVSEIRTPVFEHTELFSRGVGDTTDVVEKEMYTFEDKGARSITLRPEGTAGAARSFIENGLFNNPQPTKLYYQISCYRYEKPQAGRMREFHQFGVEYFGSQSPYADAEIIELALMIFERLGIEGLSLRINSIGCPECRKAYNEKLREYLSANYDSLCDTCKGRFERNPMRIIDCKSDICKSVVKGAPRLIDYLCDECREHFDTVKTLLENVGIKYKIDPDIVRGLDYYTKTVFEITADIESANTTICGGGRYDGLVEQLGGPSTPACGFAIGMERLFLALEAQGKEPVTEDALDIYVGSIDGECAKYAQRLVHALRKLGVSADCDKMQRSVKAQMKYANKLGVKFSAIIGGDEIANGLISIKNMSLGKADDVSLSPEEIAGYILKQAH